MTTEKFLEHARELGITIVGIGDTRHALLDNLSFPFHTDSQLFTAPHERVDSWPACWTLAKNAGIYGGVGNHGQCQADTTRLTKGVWILLANNSWGRVA